MQQSGTYILQPISAPAHPIIYILHLGPEVYRRECCSDAFKNHVYSGISEANLHVALTGRSKTYFCGLQAVQWSKKETGLYDYCPRYFTLLHLAQWQALVLNNASSNPVDDNLLVGESFSTSNFEAR